MKTLKLVPHVENETSDNVILSEEIKSSSSNNVYTVTVYQNQISCTCPAGGSKTLCKHMIEVIKKHSEELKQQTPEFLSEITNLIDAKKNKTKTKEEIKELSAKLIFVNRAISEKAHDNARFTKHHQYEEKDQRHIDTELIINEIEKTDIYSQFEFFDLLARIYSDSNLGFRYVVEPEKLKPFIKLGYLIQVEQGDNKDFYRMCRGREKCKYYYRFSEQIQDLRRLLHKHFSAKFPKKEYFDEENMIWVEERMIDPKYLEPDKE